MHDELTRALDHKLFKWLDGTHAGGEGGDVGCSKDGERSGATMRLEEGCWRQG